MAGSPRDLLPPDIADILRRLTDLLENDEKQNSGIPEPHRTGIVGGINCDEIPGSIGDFGRHVTNPIPVNGPMGQVLYLSRLRTQAQSPVMFHRLGSRDGFVNKIDLYEVLSLDGTVREKLCLSMYHPRKSRRAPSGYSLAEKVDPQNFTFSVNSYLPDFPAKLDAHVRIWHMENIGIPLPVSRIRETINGSRFAPSILDQVTLN